MINLHLSQLDWTVVVATVVAVALVMVMVVALAVALTGAVVIATF